MLRKKILLIIHKKIRNNYRKLEFMIFKPPYSPLYTSSIYIYPFYYSSTYIVLKLLICLKNYKIKFYLYHIKIYIRINSLYCKQLFLLILE